MGDIFTTLKARGFIEQHTDADALKAMLRTERVTLYCGFDATADSLHVGHLVPIMCLAHLERAGHHPIALVGGGTTLIGDPSGRTEIRRMLTREQIRKNEDCIKAQLAQFLDLKHSQVRNNIEWLDPMNYIAFLRDIGKHFSVNRMIAAECYKMRLETGLSFIEFNYMLLQAYDFYHLFKNEGCKLQVGGSDQWGNMVAGVDLIRRKLGEIAHVFTMPLILTSRGEKMGKTRGGAVWLDATKFPPYEYYQYFRNTDDADVARFLKLYTFLPMDEINELARLKDSAVNQAKETLAFEATRIAHGEDAARKARDAAQSFFYGGDSVDAPSIEVQSTALSGKGIWVVELLVQSGLVKSKGEARRLILGGGVYINADRIDSPERAITIDDFEGDAFTLRLGKKRHIKVIVVP